MLSLCLYRQIFFLFHLDCNFPVNSVYISLPCNYSAVNHLTLFSCTDSLVMVCIKNPCQESMFKLNKNRKEEEAKHSCTLSRFFSFYQITAILVSGLDGKQTTHRLSYTIWCISHTKIAKQKALIWLAGFILFQGGFYQSVGKQCVYNAATIANPNRFFLGISQTLQSSKHHCFVWDMYYIKCNYIDVPKWHISKTYWMFCGKVRQAPSWKTRLFIAWIRCSVHCILCR